MAGEKSYFSGLPKLSKTFRSALLDAHTNNHTHFLCGVDFEAVRSLFEPWELHETPTIRKLSHKEKDRIARGLPGRPGNSYNRYMKIQAAKSKGQAKNGPSSSKGPSAASASAAAAVLPPSVFSSEGSLAAPSSAPARGQKRPRPDAGVAASVAAALARGDVGAAKRAVHTAAAKRTEATGQNVSQAVQKAPSGGWDASGAFHASNGVVLQRGDEQCVFHAQGKCQHAQQPTACSYSHSLQRFPCLHVHVEAVQHVQQQLDNGVLHLDPPPNVGALRPSPFGCRRGAAKCPFSHDALSPLRFAMLERDVVQRHRRSVAAAGTAAVAPTEGAAK